MHKKSLLVTLTGRPGAGKTTLAGGLLSLFAKEGMKLLTSTTTRPPRPSDLPGEYEGVSDECFKDIECTGGFEWVVPHSGALYGTRKERFAVACTEGLHLAILTPEYVHRVRELAKPFGILSAGGTCGLQHIYLHATEDILRERMLLRGELSERTQARLAETADWSRQMVDSPHLFFEANLPAEVVQERIASRIEHWYWG